MLTCLSSMHIFECAPLDQCGLSRLLLLALGSLPPISSSQNLGIRVVRARAVRAIMVAIVSPDRLSQLLYEAPNESQSSSNKSVSGSLCLLGMDKDRADIASEDHGIDDEESDEASKAAVAARQVLLSLAMEPVRAPRSLNAAALAERSVSRLPFFASSAGLVLSKIVPTWST